MSNIYKRSVSGLHLDKIILSICFVLLMTSFTSAACLDPLTNEFTQREVTAAGLPITSANCTVRMNNSQSYNNITDANGWVSFCVNSSAFMDNMTCVKPAKYNAVMSSMVCPNAVYLDGRVSIHMKLTNTLGEPLEAQDCYVRVFNERGYLTEDLGTNLLYKNQTFLDGNGNYVRLAGVPITSSMGTFDYGWIARSKGADGVAMYRPLQNYTAVAECNGKVQNCTFRVMNREPIHVDDDVSYLMENMQVIIFGAVIILIGWFFILPSLLKTLKGG